MSEASETAINMIRRAGTTPAVKTMDEARAWVKAHWPDWADWIGFVMLDNIAEAVLREAKRNG